MIGAVVAGGALGALGRYGLGVAFGPRPAVTFAVNLLGCLLIGVLAVLIGEVWSGRRLLRPFLGTGLLGGFTTFSGYALDAQRLLAAGRTIAAAAYLGGTLTSALVAVQLGVLLARALTRIRTTVRRRH